MDPELIREAHAAIAAGADPAAVAAQFKQLSGGADLPSPGPAPQAPPTPELAAQQRLSAGGGGALSDFLRMAGQGTTFGFGDELVGLVAGKEAGTRSRQRVDDLRTLARGASLLSEITGAVPSALLPVAAGVRAVRAGGGLMAGIGRGALAGGLQGGLFGALAGAGEADAGNRAKGALAGGVGGAVVGGALGAVPVVGNALMRGGRGRGERVAGELADATGLTPDFNAVRSTADDAVSAARAQHYGPLDAMGKVPGVTNEPRSLGELQRLQRRLERTDPIAAADVRSKMERAFPGLKAADQAYAPTAQVRDALTNGRKAWNKSAADIAQAQGRLSPEALTAFREGQFHEIVRRLNAREDGTVEVLRRFMDAGPETQAQVRTLFDDDATFNSFLRVLGRERSAEKVATTLRRLAPWGLPIGVAGTLGAQSLFR